MGHGDYNSRDYYLDLFPYSLLISSQLSKVPLLVELPERTREAGGQKCVRRRLVRSPQGGLSSPETVGYYSR